MNRWNIPDWLESEVRARDGRCIYCGNDFLVVAAERRRKPSWEHIVNDARIVTRENIALCCVGCNSSKGAKTLSAWLQSRYCESRGISVTSIAEVARAALAEQNRSAPR
jgi:hypothetical protein